MLRTTVRCPILSRMGRANPRAPLPPPGDWYADYLLGSYSSSSAAARDENQTVILPDGRTLGFATYGPQNGTPIISLHGFPSSRLEDSYLAPAADRLSARIVSLDRPGIGLSTPQPNRTLLSLPSDISALAAHLDIPSFRVLGSSGGGAYALACAKLLPKEQLNGVGILAGMGPWSLGLSGMSFRNRVVWNLMRHFPKTWVDLMEKQMLAAAQDSDPDVLRQMVVRSFEGADEGDRAVLGREGWVDYQVGVLKECFKQGMEGYEADMGVLTGDWGFELGQVGDVKIKLWYGGKDVNTPVRMGKEMEKRLSNAHLKIFPGETHVTLGANHAEEILMDLLQDD